MIFRSTRLGGFSIDSIDQLRGLLRWHSQWKGEGWFSCFCCRNSSVWFLRVFYDVCFICINYVSCINYVNAWRHCGLSVNVSDSSLYQLLQHSLLTLAPSHHFTCVHSKHVHKTTSLAFALSLPQLPSELARHHGGKTAGIDIVWRN